MTDERAAGAAPDGRNTVLSTGDAPDLPTGFDLESIRKRVDWLTRNGGNSRLFGQDLIALLSYLDAQAEQITAATEAAAQAALAMVESGRAAQALRAELARVEAELALAWSTRVPSEPGWYWHREGVFMPHLMHVQEDDDGSLWVTLNQRSSRLDQWHGEWAGPLPRPAEPAP